MKRASRAAARGEWRGAEIPVMDEADHQELMDQDEPILELQVENGDQMDLKEKSIWRGPTDGKVHKRVKKTAGQKNLRLKKYVQPKNAVVCLNELKPGIVYTVEQRANGCGSPTFVTVEVDGQIYRGFGSTKQLAKQAAAEAALISFVKPPPTPTATGEAPQEDATPWAVLACFAMYKLFNEWREGRVGTMPSMMTPPTLMQDPNLTQTLQALLNRQMQTVTPMEGVVPEVNNIPNPALAAYLGKSHEADLQNTNENSKPGVFSRLGSQPGATIFNRLGAKLSDPSTKSEIEVLKVACKPAKQVPENAHLLHPVMLLHQMRPAVQFTQSSVVKDGKNVFSIAATIDDQTFIGEATNVKKAKYDLAEKANAALFDIVSSYVPPK